MSQPAPHIDADFVIVFSTLLTEKSEQASLATESQYNQLFTRLRALGLQATGRPGAKGSNEILIFVKTPDAKLHAEVERERISDWLSGVLSTRPDPRSRRDFVADPITPSERLRLTYRLITGPTKPTRRAETACAGILPMQEPFPRVKSIFAPHDPAYNKRWLGKWTSLSHVVGIPIEELDMIKDQLGEGVAFYFAFLRAYFASLTVPATVGVIAWYSGQEFNMVYSFLLVLWSIIFIEAWTLREKRLAVRWNCYGVREVAGPRADFKPDHVEDGQPRYTWYKQELRILTSIPVLIAFAAALACLISIIYSIEVFINEMYDGPGKRFLALVPTIMFAGVVPQVVAIWQSVALRLTKWENHAHSASFDKSLTLKLFSLNAVVSFGALTLTAYVYIPFGALLMPHVQTFIRSHVPLADKHLSATSQSSAAFNVNAERLHNTLFALMTTTQVVGAITENIVPVIMRYVFSRVSQVQESRSQKGGEKSPHTADESDEHTYLERIRSEAALPAYDLFVDYAEMAVQFGFVTLWSVVWPLASLMAFINDFFELRSDAFKMTTNVRRPTPTRTDSLGPWLDVLGFITWLAALANSSLIYLYRPHPEHHCDPAASGPLSGAARAALNATANALNSTTLEPAHAHLSPREAAFATSNIHLAVSHTKDSSTFLSLRGTLFTALLVALASEHGYVLARSAVRHVLERALWRGTPEEIALRHSEERLRVQYMDSMGLEIPQTPAISAPTHDKLARAGTTAATPTPFWSRPDQGVDEIKRLLKKE